MSRKALPSARPVHPCLLSVFNSTQGAEYSTWAHITTSKTELPNLVTAQASTLCIYTLSAETAKLELTETFSHLAGTIVFLEALKSPSGPDSLLIGFAGHPRLAVCSLQAPASNVMAARPHLLLATSLLDLTPALVDACVGSVTPLDQDLIATLLDRGDGPDKTVALILGGGVAVAAVALHFAANAWHASEPFLMPLATLALPLTDHKSAAAAATSSAATTAPSTASPRKPNP